MGTFIHIRVEREKLTAQICHQLVSLCPVEIFAIEDDELLIRSEQQDECTLCELCLDAAPSGVLTIQKKYKNESLTSRGGKNAPRVVANGEPKN
jgi:ferredoxin-like protein FixX